MPTNMEEIYTIYTDALSTAERLTQKEAKDLSYQELQEAESCLDILQIFRKYTALQLGQNVLNKHKQEYLAHLQATNETSYENISYIDQQIGKNAEELRNVYDQIKNYEIIRDSRKNNRKVRKGAKLATRKFEVKVEKLKGELNRLKTAKKEQEEILEQNNTVLTNLQRANQDTSAFFDFILKNDTELNTLVAQYADKSLRELINLGIILLYPNRNGVTLVKDGLDGRKVIDSELLDFLVLYLEHPEIKAQLEKINNCEKKIEYNHNRLLRFDSCINDVKNRCFFGTEKFGDEFAYGKIDHKSIIELFEQCFPNTSHHYYTGEFLPASADIRSSDKKNDIEKYKEFYRELSIDLTVKLTGELLNCWKYINEKINGKVWDTELDIIARRCGHPVEHTKPKDKEEINFLPNIYLHKNYEQIYKKISARLKDISLLSFGPDHQRIIRNGNGYNYIHMIANNEKKYEEFAACLKGLITDIDEFKSLNPQLAKELNQMYEPLLNMAKISESHSSKDNVDYGKNDGRIVTTCSNLHMESLNGLLILFKKFLELEKPLLEIEEKKIKVDTAKKYNLKTPLPPISHIGKVIYYYTGHRHITFDIKSDKGQGLSQHDKNEHNEWERGYEKLLTIQKITRFISEREKGPVNLSDKLMSHLEQDLIELMDKSVKETKRLH